METDVKTVETGGFVLLPGVGVHLPRAGGLLGFGTRSDSARRRLAWFGPVSSVFVCGIEWCWTVRIADRVVTASAGEDGLLEEIEVRRSTCYASGEPAGFPVLYGGFDVFAFSLPELESVVAFPDDGSLVFHRRWEPRPEYVGGVILTAPWSRVLGEGDGGRGFDAGL